MKKVLLIKPPEKSLFNFGTFSLGVLAAAVRDIAEITIMDATDSPLSEASSKAVLLEPDIIGLTAMGLQSINSCVEFIKELKKPETGALNNHKKRTGIVVGGHGASMLPKPFLEAGADYVVIGEGEETFREIIRNGKSKNISGSVRMENEKIIFAPKRKLIFPLNKLNAPARDLMPSPPNGVHLLETSRGCPHDCLFCETTRFNGRRWRAFSAERVVDDIQRLVEVNGAWIIHFADDNFTANTKRVKKICGLLRGSNLPAFFMLSARTDDLISDPDLLPMMAEAKMLRITVGIETLDIDLGKKIKKTISPDIYSEAFMKMRELGIFSIGSLIIGLPGETAQARKQSLELALKVGPDSAHFLPFQPQPGTPLAENHGGYDADPEDIKDAKLFNRLFFQHPSVQNRLKEMAALDSIQGLLARHSLNNPLNKHRGDIN